MQYWQTTYFIFIGFKWTFLKIIVDAFFLLVKKEELIT
jgi:hypothetical protein